MKSEHSSNRGWIKKIVSGLSPEVDPRVNEGIKKKKEQTANKKRKKSSRVLRYLILALIYMINTSKVAIQEKGQIIRQKMDRVCMKLNVINLI